MQHPVLSWRLRRGLSQARAAALLEVNVQTLQSWEQGRRSPPPYLRHALAHLDTLAEQERSTHGPAAGRVWTAKELADIRLGRAWPTFFRLPDGSWSNAGAVHALPEGALYFQTEATGDWFERRKGAPGMGSMPTGQRGPWPAYRPWDDNDKKDVDRSDGS